MATAIITPDKDAIHVEVFVAAPPERVFQAITDPAQTAQWWGDKGMYRVTTGHADVRPGGTWSSEGVGADGTKFKVDGEYLEVDPPRLLVHTWNPDFSKHKKKTVVRWELEPRPVHGLQQSGPHKMGNGTALKIIHSGFAGDEKDAADHGNGWTRVLGWMQAFVEQGLTIDTRS